MHEMDSGFKDSCTGDCLLYRSYFMPKPRNSFHGPAHNPYQVDLVYRRIINHNHQVPEETCKWKRAPRKYWMDWIDHSIRDSLRSITGNSESCGQCNWKWIIPKILEVKLNQNNYLECYCFSRLIPSLPRAGGHHTPVQEV